jgi:hypothetical protein
MAETAAQTGEATTAAITTWNETARIDRELFDGGPPCRPQRSLGLIKPGEPRIVWRVILVVLLGWVPLIVLAQVVSNVYAMDVIPIDLRNLVLLILATLLPFAPVALMAVPLDVGLTKLSELLL